MGIAELLVWREAGGPEALSAVHSTAKETAAMEFRHNQNLQIGRMALQPEEDNVQAPQM